MRSIKKILCYLGTLIVSVYGAIFFAVNTYLKGKWQFLFVLLYFEFMQILLLYFLKKANERIKVKKMQYIFCSILAGTTAFLFLDATEINFPRDKTTVRIEATGEKNENSKGSEIWMGGISIDGEKVNLDTIWHDSVWKYDPSVNYLIATPSEYSSAIQFSCEQARKIEIEFQTSEYSGIVEITDDEKNEKIDLYEKENGSRRYIIDVPTRTTLFWRSYAYISSFILFLMLYYSLVLYLNRKRIGV